MRSIWMGFVMLSLAWPAVAGAAEPELREFVDTLSKQQQDRPLDEALGQQETPIRIHVDADGALRVGDRKGTAETLPELITLPSDAESAQVQIVASQECPHRRIVEVLDALSELGITKISVAVRPIHAPDTDTPTPSIEQLRTEFERRVLAEVPAAGEDSGPLTEAIRDINRTVAQIARDVYGDHPKVLRAKAKELLNELPTIQSDAWAGHVEREGVDDIVTINAIADLPEGGHALEAALLASGWQPKRAASLMKQIVFARALSPEQLGKRANLAYYVPDRIYRVTDREKTTLAVKSLHDFLIVEVRLTEAGVFVPVSATWMTPK